MDPSSETPVIQRRESVGRFSETAMRLAIREAKQPARAAAMMARLRHESAEDADGFLGMAMCVILGEAHVTPAIPLLLDVATAREETCLRNAASYALCRMGVLSLCATMDRITLSNNPWVRVLGYEILQAAVDVDHELRTRVADFCVGRAAIETARRWLEDGWDPAAAVCDTLVVLDDERVKPFLQAQQRAACAKSARAMWAAMLADLEAGRRWFVAPEWRVDWPEMCREWACLSEPSSETHIDLRNPEGGADGGPPRGT